MSVIASSTTVNTSGLGSKFVKSTHFPDSSVKPLDVFTFPNLSQPNSEVHTVVLDATATSSWLESSSRGLTSSSLLGSISLNSSELNSSSSDEISSTFLSIVLSSEPEFSSTLAVSSDPLINIMSEAAL